MFRYVPEMDHIACMATGSGGSWQLGFGVRERRGAPRILLFLVGNLTLHQRRRRAEAQPLKSATIAEGEYCILIGKGGECKFKSFHKWRGKQGPH